MTAEADDTEARLNELRDAVLADWVRVTADHAGALRDMQNSLSWRITRPLRLARTYQMKASEAGVLEATRIAAAMVASKVGARR